MAPTDIFGNITKISFYNCINNTTYFHVVKSLVSLSHILKHIHSFLLVMERKENVHFFIKEKEINGDDPPI
jgi:hypothetical protein